MIKTSLVTTLLAACFTYASAGNIISSRSFPSCGYIGEKIYCWGGDTSPVYNVDWRIDEDIYYLNVKEWTKQSSEVLITQWEKVTPQLYFWIGQRRTPTSVAFTDGKRLMVQGGNNPGNFKYLNQTAIYDASTNSWSKGWPYEIQNEGVKQIYGATAVNLPNGLLGFYGGFEQYANIDVPVIAGNGNAVTFASQNLSYVGFSSLITHNTNSGVWAPYSPQGKTLLDFYPNFQTATVDPISGKIHYLGGTYYTTTSNWASIKIPFNWAPVFDTQSGNWGNETLTGNIPSTRMHHTANLLPNSRDIILYGGSEDDAKASISYCYTLNLESNVWTKHDNVSVPEYLSGPRFSHSAVLVNNALFILFGRGADGGLTPSLVTLNVANASNIFYTATSPEFSTEPTSNKPDSNNPTNTNTNSNTNNTVNSELNESSGLSKGAIGGIATGSVVAGLGIIAFVFFYLRRQKKEKLQDIHENMDVDWDKIEEHYKEVPTTKPNPPQPAEVPEKTENTSVRQVSPSLTEASTVNINPNVVVEMVKPSVNSLGNYVSVKPEGS